MCHGAVDTRTLELEALDRLGVRDSAPRSPSEAEERLPADLMGGWAGALARLRALAVRFVPRRGVATR